MGKGLNNNNMHSNRRVWGIVHGCSTYFLPKADIWMGQTLACSLHGTAQCWQEPFIANTRTSGHCNNGRKHRNSAMGKQISPFCVTTSAHRHQRSTEPSVHVWGIQTVARTPQELCACAPTACRRGGGLQITGGGIIIIKEAHKHDTRNCYKHDGHNNTGHRQCK